MKLLTLPDNEILDIIKPLAESMENGWNENDYQRFSINQTDDMKQAFDLHEFTKQRDENHPLLGDHKLINFVALHKNPDNVIAIWEMSFTKREEPGLCIYHFKEHNQKVVISWAMFHA